MDRSAQTGAAGALHARTREWNTDEVCADEAFSYYREGICEAFMELAPEAEEWRRREFRAKVSSVPFSQGALNRVYSTSHLVRRTRSEIARAPEECYYLNLQLVGECRVMQGGRDMLLKPGDLGMFDSGAPFDLEHRTRPALGVASFFVPKDMLESRDCKDLKNYPSLISRDPMFGWLATEMARTIIESHQFMSHREASRLFETLVDLTAMALGGDRRHLPQTGRDAKYQAIRRLLAQNHANPSFDVTRCARLVGISVRYLQRLLGDRGESFREILLDTRLRHAESLLRSPAHANMPVTAIAMESGFSDLSHFNRTFRRRTGYSPTEWRRQEMR